MNNTSIAISLMKLLERDPVFSEGESGNLSEFFRHDLFTSASGARREELMLKSSQAKYESEEVYPWDHYFGFSLRSHLEGRVALDLGCFTGGRSIAWAQRYGLRRISGLDVEPVYIEAATLFARLYDVPSEFRVGYGEKLPVEDDSFDAILSFDVLEHVRNVGKTLAECIVYFGLSAKCFSSSRATGIPMNIVWGSSLACPVSTGGLGETLW